MKIQNKRLQKRKKPEKTVFHFSQSFDNGEIITQKITPCEEYVVQSSITDIPFKEYVVYSTASSTDAAFAEVEYLDTGSSGSPQQEMRIGIPVSEKEYRSFGAYHADVPVHEIKAPRSSSAKQEAPQKKNQEQPEDGSARTKAFGITGPLTAFEKSLGLDDQQAAEAGTEAKEDDFITDMKAIIAGQKKYNTETKSVEDNASPSAAANNGASSTDLAKLQNKHAIFDQIAQSMEYAKAYDLGSIDLEKRFEDFDKLEDVRKKTSYQQSAPVSPRPAVQPPTVESEAFLQDLSAIIQSNPAPVYPPQPVRTAPVLVAPVSAAASPSAGLYRETVQPYQPDPYYKSASTGGSNYVYMQNPGAAVIAGIEVADALQIGLGAAALVQQQVSASQGSFSLSYDKAQRLLTTNARTKMPGAQVSKSVYTRRLFYIGSDKPMVNMAKANVIIEWEGNAYGEISTAVIRRELASSTEWTYSAANITISKIDRIPAGGTDPRTWPLIFSYEGTFNPATNGYFEFSGEFEINAFGGMRFIRHDVVPRSAVDFMMKGNPADYVQKGPDIIVPIPSIPEEQINYLRSALP